MTIAAGLVLPTALALDAGTRTFYLYEDGAMMREGTPTNADPTGLLTRHVERENGDHASRTAVLGELRILREDAFRVHLSDREPLAPRADLFLTRIHVGLVREDGREVLGHDGRRYDVGSALRAFDHPGHADVEAPGWTDFAFPANATLPTTHHCVASGCIRHEGNALVVPAGFSIRMTITLVEPTAASEGVRGIYDETFENVADLMMGVLDEANERTPLALYNPLGLSNFDPVHNDVERRLRDQDGQHLVWIGQSFALARSSWATASTTSDSRLEVRTA